MFVSSGERCLPLQHVALSSASATFQKQLYRPADPCRQSPMADLSAKFGSGLEFSSSCAPVMGLVSWPISHLPAMRSGQPFKMLHWFWCLQRSVCCMPSDSGLCNEQHSASSTTSPDGSTHGDGRFAGIPWRMACSGRRAHLEGCPVVVEAVGQRHRLSHQLL